MGKRHWGSTQALQAQGLQLELKQWYKTNKHACKIQGELSWSRIRTQGDWPKLKCKAAASRHLTQFAVFLAQKYLSHNAYTVGVCQLRCRFYSILGEGDDHIFLSTAQKDELSKLAPLFMSLYGTLSRRSVESNIKAWKLKPKFHIWVHLCELQTWLNPRSTWTYSDGDLVRICKKIAQRCHPHTVSHMVLCHWLTIAFER